MTYEAVSVKVIERVTALIMRAQLAYGADCVAVYAIVRNRMEADTLARLPLSKDSKPDEVAREVALIIEESDASKHRVECYAGVSEAGSLVLHAKGKATAEAKGATRAPAYEGKDSLLEQAYRHNEMMIRATSEAHLSMQKSLMETIERLTERNSTLEAQSIDVAIKAVNLIREDHQGRAEARRAEAQAKAIEDAAAQVTKLLPHIGEQMTAWGARKLGLPSPAAKALAPLAEAFRALTPEQIAGLQKVLTPRQMAAIGAAYETFTADDDSAAGDANGRGH